MSDFFTTDPLPCQPFNLPKYPPTKVIDAKRRDEWYRRLRETRKAHESVRRTKPRERAARAMLVPEANAEIQSNTDRMRMITHVNAKSKSEKFPPHQDGLLDFPIGLSRRFEPSEIHFSSTSFASYANEPLQMWSGPLAPMEFFELRLKRGGMVAATAGRRMDVKVDGKIGEEVKEN